MAQEDKVQLSGKNPNQKFIWIAICVFILLLFAVGGGSYYVGTLVGTSNSINPKTSKGSNKGSDKNVNDSQGYLGPLVEFKDFVVNIADGENTRYLKAAITIEAYNEDGKKEIEKRRPQIRDTVLFHLANKTFDEVRDLQGKQQLRAELKENINSILNHSKVKHIYFTEFVVQ